MSTAPIEASRARSSNTPDGAELIERARQLADDVLFPAVLDNDMADMVPLDNLDALAEAGLYGIFAPRESGGLAADLPTMCSIVETLGGGCLATTFIWIQHFGLLGKLLGAPDPLRSEWLGPACRGERRGGIAFGGLLPGPPLLRAEPGGDGWTLEGTAPWVSGWGRIDTLHVAARGPDDTVVHAAIDAVDGKGLSTERLRLVAVDASSTVRATFNCVKVPADRVLGVAPFDPQASGGRSLRLNGSLAIGVARRCCELSGLGLLDGELDECRAALDVADDLEMPAARARASELAMRAAVALMVHEGSRSTLVGQHAPRLAREAMFLLVFGSRPEVKQALLNQLAMRCTGTS
jgi:alkylation response protein AidB-like acyl-CoA dehydrogenase